jgi:hypothetical protein
MRKMTTSGCFLPPKDFITLLKKKVSINGDKLALLIDSVDNRVKVTSLSMKDKSFPIHVEFLQAGMRMKG